MPDAFGRGDVPTVLGGMSPDMKLGRFRGTKITGDILDNRQE
jgi:hypothetical protein